MKTILLFAGSNSSSSLNKQLIDYTATLLNDAEAQVVDLRDYEPPMFSVDLEHEVGTHDKVQELVGLIEESAGLIVSTPEHNGMPPAFFKNILDWLSRVQKIRGEGPQYLHEKPTLVMSTSPGRGGAAKAREHVKTILNYANANFIGDFVLPQFKENFQDGKIINEELRSDLLVHVKKMESLM